MPEIILRPAIDASVSQWVTKDDPYSGVDVWRGVCKNAPLITYLPYGSTIETLNPDFATGTAEKTIQSPQVFLEGPPQWWWTEDKGWYTGTWMHPGLWRWFPPDTFIRPSSSSQFSNPLAAFKCRYFPNVCQYNLDGSNLPGNWYDFQDIPLFGAISGNLEWHIVYGKSSNTGQVGQTYPWGQTRFYYKRISDSTFYEMGSSSNSIEYGIWYHYKFTIPTPVGGWTWAQIKDLQIGARGFTSADGLHYFGFGGMCLKYTYTAWTGPPTPAPAAILPFVAGAVNPYIATTTPTLTWSASQGVDSYYIDIASDQNFYSIVHTSSAISGAVTTYTVPSSVLSLDQDYYWRIRATNSNTPPDTTSVTAVFRIRIPTVTLTPVSSPPSHITLYWNCNISDPNITYALQVSTTAFPLTGDPPTTSLIYNISGIGATQYDVLLNNTTTYYWRVNAYRSTYAVTSAWASSSFTTYDTTLTTTLYSKILANPITSGNWVPRSGTKISTLNDHFGPNYPATTPSISSATYIFNSGGSGTDLYTFDIPSFLNGAFILKVTVIMEVTYTNWTNPDYPFDHGSANMVAETAYGSLSGPSLYCLTRDISAHATWDKNNVWELATNVNYAFLTSLQVGYSGNAGVNGSLAIDSITLRIEYGYTPPVVCTNPATNINYTSVTLNGALSNTGGRTCSCYFEYGLTNSFGSVTPTVINNAPANMSASLTSLLPGTTYYYQARAANPEIALGGMLSFTTLAYTPAYVDNNGTYPVSYTTATMNGNVYSIGSQAPTITLFYGRYWGGETPSSWETSVDCGVQSGSFTKAVTNLLPNSTLYYTVFRAVNSGGTTWSGVSVFYTLDYNEASISTYGVVSPFGPTTGSVKGYVTDIGSNNPTVTIYYGRWDQGNTETGWEYFINCGVKGLGEFTQAITNLLPNTYYYWRFKAVNLGGTAWSWYESSPTVVAAPTLNSPLNNATNVSLDPTYICNSVTNAASYSMQVATDINFTNIIINSSGILPTSPTVSFGPVGSAILAAGTSYWWRWAANNSYGFISAWSTAWKFTTGYAPTAPVLSSPSNLATGVSLTPTFVWGAVSGATTYLIQLSGDPYFSYANWSTSTASTSIVYSGSPLNVGTVYYWRVQAINNFGASALSSRSFTTGISPPAPLITNPVLNSTWNPVSLTITWAASVGATGYIVYVYDADLGQYIFGADVGNVLSKNISLSFGNNYGVYIGAYNSFGSNYTSYLTFRTLVGNSTLSTPVNGSTEIPSVGTTFNWGYVKNAIYQFKLRNSTTTLIQTADTESWSYYQSSPSLLPNTTYWWTVRTGNGTGNYNAYVTEFSFTTGSLPAAPALTSPSNGAITQPISPVFIWGSVLNASSYNIQITLFSDTGFISPVVNTTTSSTTYSGAFLSSSTQYRWRVRASNTFGYGTFSTVYTFTTGNPPIAPVLTSPINGALQVSLNPLFTWNAVSLASSYNLQVTRSSDPLFSSPTISIISGSPSYTPSVSLTQVAGYIWRVRADSVYGLGPYSTVWSFTTDNKRNVINMNVLYPAFKGIGLTNRPKRILKSNTSYSPPIGIKIKTLKDTPKPRRAFLNTSMSLLSSYTVQSSNWWSYTFVNVHIGLVVPLMGRFRERFRLHLGLRSNMNLHMFMKFITDLKIVSRVNRSTFNIFKIFINLQSRLVDKLRIKRELQGRLGFEITLSRVSFFNRVLQSLVDITLDKVIPFTVQWNGKFLYWASFITSIILMPIVDVDRGQYRARDFFVNIGLGIQRFEGHKVYEQIYSLFIGLLQTHSRRIILSRLFGNLRINFNLRRVGRRRNYNIKKSHFLNFIEPPNRSLKFIPYRTRAEK